MENKITLSFMKNWCKSVRGQNLEIDFNGDGNPDLACDSPDGDHWVILSTSTTPKSPNQHPIGLVKTSWCVNKFGHYSSWIDFNGDGKSDLVCDGPDGNHWLLLSTGTSLQSPNQDSLGSIKTDWCVDRFGHYPSWIDFNGDGKSDLACDGPDGNHWLLLSTGTSLQSPNGDSLGSIKANWCIKPGHSSWIDFNYDGKSDLACDGFDGNYWVLLSTGIGLQSPNSDINGKLENFNPFKQNIIITGESSLVTSASSLGSNEVIKYLINIAENQNKLAHTLNILIDHVKAHTSCSAQLDLNFIEGLTQMIPLLGSNQIAPVQAIAKVDELLSAQPCLNDELAELSYTKDEL